MENKYMQCTATPKTAELQTYGQHDPHIHIVPLLVLVTHMFIPHPTFVSHIAQLYCVEVYLPNI
jgi:hypothetical protein